MCDDIDERDPDLTVILDRVDVARFARDVRTIAGTTPSRVYSSLKNFGCVYSYDQQPSCLLGHALAAQGVILPTRCWENRQSVDELFGGGDAEIISWLSWVQSFQDSGAPWGKCVYLADRLAEEGVRRREEPQKSVSVPGVWVFV